MTRDLRLDVVGDSRDAGRALDKAARDLDKVNHAADELKRSFVATSAASATLDRTLERTSASSRNLSTYFSRNAVAARVAAAEANKYARAVDDLGDELDRVGRKKLPGGGSGAGGGSGGLNFASLPVNPVTAGLLAHPVTMGLGAFAGAAAGGATIAAAGLGAVGLGIGGAIAGDPRRFGDAWTAEVERISRKWQSASADFAEPTLAAVHKLGQAVMDVDLDGMLSKAATFVEPLTAGVTKMIAKVGEGVESLVEHAGPVIDAIADRLPAIGDAIGDAFRMIGSESEGGARALKDFLVLVEGVIRVGGFLIAVLERVYEDFTKLRSAIPGIGPLIDQALDINQPARFAETIEGVTPTVRDLAEATDKTANSYRNAAGALETYLDHVNTLYGATMDVLGATLSYEESLDKLTASLQENGRHWDISTEKGRNNISATKDAIDAAYRQRQANIDNGMSAAQANEIFRKQTESILAQARAAGASSAVIGQLTAAWWNFLALPDTKTFRVRVIQTGSVSAQGVISSGVPNVRGSAYASGTPSAMPGWAWVGEEGPEMVRFNGGEVVLNHQRSMAAASRVTRGYAGGTPASGSPRLVHNGTPSELEALFLSWLQKQIRTGQLQVV